MQSAPRGRLKLAAPVSFGTRFVAPLLPALLADSPELVVELTLTNRVVNVVEEGFDVALVCDHDLPQNLAARSITHLRRGLYGAPDYLARRGAPAAPADLRHHNCLPLMNSPMERAWQFRAGDGTVTVRVGGSLMINNLDAIRGAVLGACGLALLPRYLVERDVARGELVALLEDHEAVGTHVHAVFPPARHLAPKIRTFVDFMVAHFAAGAPVPLAAAPAMRTT
jgi:DNA-binding transcriptional LysR family regulator